MVLGIIIYKKLVHLESFVEQGFFMMNFIHVHVAEYFSMLF
jgi:hypothetical protein